jgi:hypothetical protein
MVIRFSMMRFPAALAAGLLALCACSETAADSAEAPAAMGETPAQADPAAADKAEVSTVAATSDNAGPGEFKETVKTVRCKVYDPGGDYDGPCKFTQWEGGSFMVSRDGDAEFFNGITEVVVEIDAPGIAGGSIRQAGESNFLGTMERHSDDRACWSSADFTVCAY